MVPTTDEKFAAAYRRHRGDIRGWSRNYRRIQCLPGYAAEDLEQECLKALWKAVQTYDPDKGVIFESWFRVIRDRAYIDLLKAARREFRRNEHFWEPPLPDASDDGVDRHPSNLRFSYTVLESSTVTKMVNELRSAEPSAEEEVLALHEVAIDARFPTEKKKFDHLQRKMGRVS